MSGTAFRLKLVLTVALLASTAALNASVPLLFAEAVDRFAGTRPDTWIAVGAGGILVAYVGLHWLSRLLSETRWALYGPVEQHLQRRLALHSIEHLHNLSLGFHLSRRTGHISRVMDNGLRGLRELVFDSVFVIVPLASEITFVAIVMLFALDWVFAVVLFGTLAFYGTVLVIGSERLRAHQRRAVARGAAAHGEAVDSLLNYETVKLFGNEDFIAGRYDLSLAEVERLVVRSMSFRSALGAIMATIVAAGMGLILWLAVARVRSGAMTVGELVLVNAYLLQLARPMERLGNLYRSIKQALVELEELLGLLALSPDIADRPGAKPLPAGPGAISFEHVSFAYNPDRGILHDASFGVAPGRKIAIVGPTGSGKSTVMRLLFRFYEPDAGHIRIDGADIGDVTLASLRAAVAVVPQDPVLFNASIGANIGFGRPDASHAEIVDAALAAELGDFIARLPKGYDTLVGERGLKLSGGEKQRVAIARALLKRPRILLLDEATSALDSATEERVQSSLRRIAEGTTTVVIAHRLSTVVDADGIVVLDHGRVAERGTHGELLAKGGLYADLWQRQARDAGAELAAVTDETSEAV
jgi:ATP-binding cassette subfamily B protein